MRFYEETDVKTGSQVIFPYEKVYPMYKKVHPNKVYHSNTKVQAWFKFIFQANTPPSTENPFLPKENTK